MENIQVKVEGTKLIIEVDLSKNLGLSSTGKSILVAKTGGFVAVSPEVKFGLNVIRSK